MAILNTVKCNNFAAIWQIFYEMCMVMCIGRPNKTANISGKNFPVYNQL